MTPTVTAAELNRCVLTRQLLVERSTAPLTCVLERMGGLQAQYAPSMYIGLWSRVSGFSRRDLDAALVDRTVVQGTLLRATIHLVSRRDYWPMTIAVREPRRQWFLRAHRPVLAASTMIAAAERARAMLADGPVDHATLTGVIGRAEMAGLHVFADIVRVPPSGTWARRRANLYALAEHWVGPEPALSVDAARELVVRRHLGGFCPSRPADIAGWAGLPVDTVTAALERIGVRRLCNEAGKELVDLDGQGIPDGAEPVPVIFLPTWDATLLAHCRAAVIIRESDRARIFTSANPTSEATFLVDGVVEGTWRHDGQHVVTTPFRPLTQFQCGAVEEAAARLSEVFAPR